MKLLSHNKIMSTGLAALLASFFVLSSFVPADAHWRRWRHSHRGSGVAAGIIAGAIIGGAIIAGSQATKHRKYRRHRHRHCHRNRRGRIYNCHRHRHNRRHHR